MQKVTERSGQRVRVFISAGESSGDVHSANFIRSVKAICPQIEFEGFGGPRMAEAGCHLYRSMLDLSVIGLPFLGHIREYLKLIRQFWWIIRTEPVAALILVDYPGLHFILARLARWRGIPVIYYICPQIWGWGPWRRSKILRLTDLLLVILPFELELYKNKRTPVVYVGHPLTDELIAQKATEKGAILRKELNLPAGAKVIGVFPGSRTQEVRALMPLFRGILEEMGLDPEHHWILVSSCREEFRPLIEETLSEFAVGVQIMEQDTHALMAACDFALVASGTASLELAFFGKPMLVLYRISAVALFFYRQFSVNPFVSLVNILGRGEIVPERVVSRSTAGDLAQLAQGLFFDTEERELCERRLGRLREEVFQSGGVARAARAMVEFMEKKELLEVER